MARKVFQSSIFDAWFMNISVAEKLYKIGSVAACSGLSVCSPIAALETLKRELQCILNRWQEQPSPECITRTICPNIQRD